MKYIQIQPTYSCKLCDPEFFQQISPYSQILTDQEYEAENLLSPALMDNLRMKNLNPKHDEQKSQIFTLGMIILKMGVLQDMRNLYNYQEGEINIKELKRRIKDFQSQYSKKITTFMKKCLVLEEKDRMNLRQLVEYSQNLDNNEDDDMFESDESIDQK